MTPGSGDLVVATWNVFHLRDGHPAAGPTAASTLLGRPVLRDGRLHLNRAYPDEVAAVVRRLAPTVCALQEVPSGAVPHLARRLGRDARWVRTGLPLGGATCRWRLGRANPDLWRTHQGNANALLVDPGWEVVPGSVRAWRVNPLGLVARVAHRDRLPPGEVLRWVIESRSLLALTLQGRGGGRVAVACLHAHNARAEAQSAAELGRVSALLAAYAPPPIPLVLAGDLNARAGDPPVEALRARLGLAGGAGAGDGIDHLLHRGLDVVQAPAAAPRALRELVSSGPGPAARVLLSDHDPVVARYRLRGAGLTGSAPRAARP